MALLLDPWLFHRSAAILAAAGFALGALGTAARARRLPAARPAPARRTLALLVAAAVIVPTLLVLPGPPWFHPISGDEPHYLVIARSLWADGDLDVANEYSESLLSPFWPGELSPHAKPGADPEKSYSIHGTGLAVWLAPWYGAGSGLSEEGFNVLVRMAMSLWLAAGAACLFLLLGDIAGPTAATRGTVLAVFTLPLLFAGPHLFPAVPVFTLSCGAYLLIRREPGPAGYLAAGLLLAALPWLHFKFFGVMAAVCLIGTLRLRRREPGRARILALAAFIAPQAISGLGHVAFTWALYGRISPLAIHVGADAALRATAAGDDWLAYVTDPLGALRDRFRILHGSARRAPLLRPPLPSCGRRVRLAAASEASRCRRPGAGIPGPRRTVRPFSGDRPLGAARASSHRGPLDPCRPHGDRSDVACR